MQDLQKRAERQAREWERRENADTIQPSSQPFVRLFVRSFIYYNVFVSIFISFSCPQVLIPLRTETMLEIEGCFQYTIYIIVLNNVLTPENACRMLIAKRHIKTRMYLAIKWKIYNKACYKYCILYAIHRVVFRLDALVYARVCVYRGARIDSELYGLLRKMTMIKTRPTTMATILAPTHTIHVTTIIQYNTILIYMRDSSLSTSLAPSLLTSSLLFFFLCLKDKQQLLCERNMGQSLKSIEPYRFDI